ncbi:MULTISPECIES: flagellar hook-associated protein FlgL [Rummeliibacillus]|uniref:flagellar hook-associated protein FlgL n=1 Tax=Rummeliibacillus TaxID=648802 RepID=UPI00116DB4BC|nr:MULTISPECIES: flagellar hook-associated protein FlgL [Rummeliibacillus]MBB5170209.1 flagellar hook-associated protein 3 FlgL [Rummeliibacillus stabekisii]GEL04468.1 flagellar hook-associated protein 3 [Rummeliibacillus stabekisii]
MRVTQSMLSNNMLRNLSSSYGKMGDLQRQVETGKKVNRPSDDPVVVMKGINYRTALGKIEQYERNIGEVNNWLDTSDNTLDKVNAALQRTNDLLVQAANGTTTEEDRDKIKAELKQLRQHVQDMSNTKIGEKYIFSGTKTNVPPFDKTTGTYSTDPAFEKTINIEIFDGISLQSNITPLNTFQSIDDMFARLDSATTTEDFSNSLTELNKNSNELLTIRSDIGARQNRVELMEDRLASQEISATKQMSDNEDVDYEKAITNMITQESIHRAALSVGARIIQPSLTDFLR